MRVHLRGYGVDAFRSHSLRAKGNDTRSRLIVVRILFSPKGIYDGFVSGRGWCIITRRVLLKEERQNLVGSPTFGNKNVVNVMLWKLPVRLHEITTQFNA